MEDAGPEEDGMVCRAGKRLDETEPYLARCSKMLQRRQDGGDRRQGRFESRTRIETNGRVKCSLKRGVEEQETGCGRG
jgi:hypothetical protein